MKAAIILLAILVVLLSLCVVLLYNKINQLEAATGQENDDLRADFNNAIQGLKNTTPRIFIDPEMEAILNTPGGAELTRFKLKKDE
ncbi:hypothetical protein C7967_11558 [Thalassospira sp. 11-3]|nr:hypothetical protein C7967_11558 [Thalassospira sp. 11-3]